MTYYFAFGSNLNFKQMKNRCPDSRPVGPAILPNYCLSFSGYTARWGGAGACTLHSSGDLVHGGLYEVSDKDLDQLDMFEGAPKIYERKVVEVVHKDQPIEAVTYIKKDAGKYAHPSELYLLTILEGCRDFGLSPLPMTRLLINQKLPCYSVFAYGLLKRGGNAHNQFMQGYSSCSTARLDGFKSVFGHVLDRSSSMLFIHPEDGEYVSGELFDYSDDDDFHARMSGIDAYEWFQPDNLEESLYERTLVAVTREGSDKQELAWVYAAGMASGHVNK